MSLERSGAGSSVKFFIFCSGYFFRYLRRLYSIGAGKAAAKEEVRLSFGSLLVLLGVGFLLFICFFP